MIIKPLPCRRCKSKSVAVEVYQGYAGMKVAVLCRRCGNIKSMSIKKHHFALSVYRVEGLANKVIKKWNESKFRLTTKKGGWE